MLSHRFVFTLFAAVVMPVAVCAQVISGDTAHASDLVVTASRTVEPANTLPAGITVLHGDDLRARGVTMLIDALREVPGVALVQTGSAGSLTSLFMRGGESDYVKVLLDGVPLNLPGGSINFANLTTTDLDRVEIVRGPASVLYGADAMSGVIQLFTRKAADGASGEVSGRAGTFGSSDYTAHLGVAKRGWSLSANGSRNGTDGIYDFNSQFRNIVGSGQFGYSAGDRGHALATIRYGDGVAHFPTDGNGVPVDHNQFSTEHSLALGLDIMVPLGRTTALSMQGFASRLLQGFQNRQDTPADTNSFDFIEDRDAVTWRRGLDLRLDAHLRPTTTLSFGAGVERETDDESDIGTSNFGFGISTDTTALEAARTTHNLYAQLLAAPARDLTLQLGGRFDHNSAFGDFGTWRAGASWHLAPGARLWGALGTAFKAPTFAELFASSAFEIGNPALVPERSSNSEVGLETRMADNRLSLGVTAFWQSFRDLVQYVFTAPGATNYQNLGAARSRGVELSLNGNLSATVALSAQWSWLHTEVTDTGFASSVSNTLGASLVRRPHTTGSATLSYRRKVGTGAVTVTHVGERDDLDFSGPSTVRITLPGYTTVAAAAEIPVTRANARATGLDLTVRTENLFDTKYLQTVGYPGRGRTLLAGARLLF